MFKRWLFVSLAALSAASFAADDARQIVTQALHSVSPAARIDAVVSAEMPGFYQATVNGHVVYVSADGRYLIQGDVYEMQTHVSLTEQAMAGARREALAKISSDKELVFSPPNPKHTITVFTDVDCPYCRQFHKQIGEYN